MRGTTHRILTTLVALLALQLGSLVAPAWACGCGAMITRPSERIGVDREESAVHWDGRNETVVMRFRVHGDARQAAWVMPVPHRADVTLGDPELFDAIEELAAPERRDRSYFWPREDDWPFDTGYGDGAAAGAAPGGAVGVVGRERLGPFDVARLTATDPEALGTWLRTNGFELPDRLTPELRPYVERKWEYVAIRLAPEKRDERLHGELTPLRVTFASPELVYPMRLSRLAATPQTLGLSILAAHRMEPRSAIGGDRPEVTFSGRLDHPEGPVAALTGGAPAHLTVLEQRFPTPSRISDDHVLRTVADTPYRQVVYRDRLLTLGGVPAWLLAVAAGAALAVTAALLTVRARRRRVPSPV
ncbi:DUF2330 domain-containing protein [Streptomyces hydrogenans]|uniref:DUF2330 domain-containing protein n=1 Tax=Streptomyces hydrogenans TaxID=1873719 RepID=A0ABQ3P8C8_9ACTN|nr:DUF2330 domain-containing protein [Streptomyces hydrogenans]GHG18642.1 hypothetical protein GCM10018784_34790 [Streptomyces hydrogenans]GHI21274.1 hypothetical protein Shyd_26450 [Streptomyces hydrogenans]